MTDIDKSEIHVPVSRKRPVKLFIFSFLWLTIVVGFSVSMIKHSNEPGASGLPPRHWPKNKELTLDEAKPTLVMFAHPHCPCTNASIDELAILMAQCQGLLNAKVVFIRPNGLDKNWTETGLKQTASQIPGVTVLVDSGCVLAKLFHCETSGSTLLYDQKGSLIFKGGITIARGHAGDNPGRSAIAEIVHGGKPQYVNTPVFGCSLFNNQCPMELQKGESN